MRNAVRLILLVRHGVHDEVGRVLSGRSDIPLNDAGRHEAEQLAAHLARMPIRSLHVSPRRRTLETAVPVGELLRLPIEIAPALDEIDFGRFTGRSFADLAPDPDWQRWNSDRAAARCPGGETMAEAVARAADYLFALPESAFPLLAVTHCDIIRGLVAHILGMTFDRMFALDCDPGSVTTLALDNGGGVRLVSLNLRPD
jgi:ribonuclease H / adenosylcobalamin/alpha-ribazole phosphatase